MWFHEIQLTMTNKESNKLDVICKDHVKFNEFEIILKSH